MDSISQGHPPIWQKHCFCPSGERKTCWFAKNRGANRKEEAGIPAFHCRNFLGKPPSLLRLSSTGDTVDDTSDFSSFEPSNLRRSESNLQDSAKPNSGVFKRIAKFAFSENNSDFKQSTAKSFVSESSENMANQVDLSILMEKFDSHQNTMETCRQFESMPARVHPQQGVGGMRGFVREGIYHPYPRHAPDHVGSARQGPPVVTERKQPLAHAFPLFNISPFWNSYHHQHPHPYMNKARFVPERRPNNNMTHFWHGAPVPGIAPAVSEVHSHTPLAHVGHHHHGCQRAQIRDQAGLRNWINDPRVRSQLINTESIADRLQGQHATNMQSQQRVPHHASRNPMMKTRTELSHQNTNPNKAAGCVHTGNSHQARKHPHYSNAKTLTQATGSPKKSPVHQSSSECFSIDKAKHQDTKTTQKTSDRNAEEKYQVPKLDENNKDLESVTKIPKIEAKNEQKVAFPESDVESNAIFEQSVHCPAHVTSPVDTAVGQSGTACIGAQNAPGPKSEDNETSCYKSGRSVDTGEVLLGNHASSGSQVFGSQDEQDAIQSQLVQSSCIQESCNVMSEDDGVSNSTQGQSCENEDSRLSSSSTSPVLSQKVQAGSSPPESASSDSPKRKPLHSSLAFLLAEMTVGENDFSDSDWDSTSSSPPSDSSWDFLKCSDDPYNPLYGWRCAHRSEKQEQETETKQDDELDSGISSLQTQQDDSGEVSPTESESWDEDESSSEESTQLAKSPSVDPVNSSAPVNAPVAATTDSTETQFQVQSQVPDNGMPSTSLPECETETPRASSCDKSKSGNIPVPQSIISEPQKLHPSVFFILGCDDSDSNSECDDDDDDFDSCDADSFDNLWSSSQPCPDPYSPLQGWQFNLTIPVKSCENLPTVNQNTDNENFTSSTRTPRQFVPEINPRPTLKRASTTGCLWIPYDGCGPGRPVLNKKVHFCTDTPLVINLNESPSWSMEYSASRRGPWQEMARDRCRFRDRIRCIEGQIGHVFTPEHRQRVWQRMQTLVS